MKKLVMVLLISSTWVWAAPIAMPTGSVKLHEHNGNKLSGVATKDMGAQEIEVWRSGLAPGSCTPLHRHDREEVIILLEGTMSAISNGEEVVCHAPCTIILPKDETHILKNQGTGWTSQLAIMPAQSRITKDNGEAMVLPWREEGSVKKETAK